RRAEYVRYLVLRHTGRNLVRIGLGELASAAARQHKAQADQQCGHDDMLQQTKVDHDYSSAMEPVWRQAETPKPLTRLFAGACGGFTAPQNTWAFRTRAAERHNSAAAALQGLHPEETLVGPRSAVAPWLDNWSFAREQGQTARQQRRFTKPPRMGEFYRGH